MNSEEEIFAAAAALPAEERAAYLDEACAGEPDLRARIEALLISHEVTGFMEDRTAVVGGQPLAEQSGERIGRYRLLQQIGEGGFGVVWMAEQVEPVTRRVALKIIKAGMDTREVIARFEAERQALAMMDHPNIAKVLDAGATDKGRPFFVMELVKGIPITKFCDEREFTTRQRLELFADVCSAINHAHQKGVIHRDIKPSNVMVTLSGDRPVVKVIDFGIAKATQGKLTDRTLFTRFEQFLGTPAYMSPEQAAITDVDIDTRSDIYSLGVLLYELLTGKPPFETGSLLSAGYEEMRRIIREVEPPKPSTRLKQLTAASTGADSTAKSRVAHLKSRIPCDLDWIVMKAIEKDRSRRYETANGFAMDIWRHLANEPVSAGRPSWLYRFRKTARRHTGLVAVVATILLALISGVIVTMRQAIEARDGERAARSAEAVAILEETRARLRDGQWVNRSNSVTAIRRSHQLHPSDAARDVLVSLLSLPELKRIGSIPYSRQNPNPTTTAPIYLNHDFTRYVAGTRSATEVRDSLTHAVLSTIPEISAYPLAPGPLSSDDRLLCVPGKSGINIWDIESVTKLGTLPAGFRPPGFSYDGRVVAANGGILQTAIRPPVPLPLKDRECDGVALSPDGTLLLTAHHSRLLMRLIDATSGEQLREYNLPGNSTVLRGVWSGDGKQFYTGTADGRMIRWNLNSFAPEWIVPAHTDGIDDIALFDDDNHIITVSRDGLTKIWNLHLKTNVATFPIYGRRVQVSSDGRRLALDSAAEHETRLLDFTPSSICRLVRLPSSNVPVSSLEGKCAVIPAADGLSFAVTAGFDLHILDLDGTLLKSITCGQCADLAADPSGSGFLRSRQLPSGRWELMRVPADWGGDFGASELSVGSWSQQPVLAAGASTGRLVVGTRGTIEDVDAVAARLTPHTPAALPPRGRLTAMAFSPCGRYFAWAGVENAADPSRHIHLMDAAGEKELATLPVSAHSRLLAFMPSGDAIIAASNGAYVCLETTTGRELWNAKNRRSQEPIFKTPLCIAIAEKSGTLAILLANDSVSLIDAATGRIRLTLRHPIGQNLRAIGLSPDGTRLVAVGSYIAQFWNLEAAAKELVSQGMPF